MDTGSSTGEILGHSKVRHAIFRASDLYELCDLLQVINAVSIRHQRPFRAATAGDDSMVIFHTGTPYKYEKVKLSSQDFAYLPTDLLFHVL